MIDRHETLWKRIRDGVYELRGGDGAVLATVERFDPPNNSHFSIWKVIGFTGANFPTLRDAKWWAEKRAGVK